MLMMMMMVVVVVVMVVMMRFKTDHYAARVNEEELKWIEMNFDYELLLFSSFW